MSLEQLVTIKGIRKEITMAQQVIKGSAKLAEAIKKKRQELGLTIQEAATKANVGMKTWCRYEAGESIRRDKIKGICKALNWSVFPGEYDDEEFDFNLETYKSDEAWSESICENFGTAAAIAFVIGSNALVDYLNDDLTSLAQMPKGTHVGELEVSQVREMRPPQFMMRFDYEFLYMLRSTIEGLQSRAHCCDLETHSVLEELALYLCNTEAKFMMDVLEPKMEMAEIDGLDDWEDWIYDLFSDDDIITYLYSDMYVKPNEVYHFDHWTDDSFSWETVQRMLTNGHYCLCSFIARPPIRLGLGVFIYFSSFWHETYRLSIVKCISAGLNRGVPTTDYIFYMAHSPSLLGLHENQCSIPCCFLSSDPHLGNQANGTFSCWCLVRRWHIGRLHALQMSLLLKNYHR